MKRLIVFALLVAVLAAACQPAAPTQIAGATQARSQDSSAGQPVPLVEEPAAEQPPAAPAQPPYNPQPPAGSMPLPQPTTAPMQISPEREGYQGQPYPPTPPPDQYPNSTDYDHLSTFGLDVDTASYTQARQAILNGYLPDPGSARVEEFVNYFEQDYPMPEGMAFGVYADGAPSPFDEGSTSLLRFGVQGYRQDYESRKPRNLTFVIDASGSMGDAGKLELVKDTLRVLLDRLGPRDTIAVVAYDDRSWVIANPTSADYRDWLMQQINQLYPGNSTDLNQGLRLGYQLANQMFSREATNRVILCTDGVANTGTTDAEGILSMIHEYAGRDITLTALGVGMGDYNDALLEQLADKGNGNYAYIDDLDEARRLFIEELDATLDVIALNAKVQVDFNPDVVAEYTQLGYESRAIADQDFRNDRVDAGEIGAGHSVTALYQVRLHPGATGRIATVQLRWEDPASHETQEINGNFNTWDLTGRFEKASPRYQVDVLAAYFAGKLRGSNWAWNASWESLEGRVYESARSLAEDRDVQELAYLISQARWMAQ